MRSISLFAASLAVVLLSACGGGGEGRGGQDGLVGPAPGDTAPPAPSPDAVAGASGALLEAPAEVAVLPRALFEAPPLVASAGGAPRCDVRLIRLRYATPGAAGEPSDASAALLVPTGPDAACAGPFTLVAYGRGTEVSRKRTMADPADPETVTIAATFAAQGYAVVATDFLGYAGSGYPFHPYLHSASEASSIVDSIRAARSAATGGIALRPRVMLYGYSSGGHATLSAQRAIETSAALAAEIDLAAASHGAAPSALSSMLPASFGYPDRRPTLFGQVLGPFYITAAQKTLALRGDRIYTSPSEVFKPPYDRYIENLFPSDDFDFFTLPAGLLPADPFGYVEPLYTQAFIDRVTRGADGSRLIAHARESDLVASGWTPARPTLLCAGSQDPVVPYDVSQQLAVARWSGAPAVQAIEVDAAARLVGQQAWLQQSAEQQAVYGGSFDAFLTQGYHDVFAAPVCLGAAKTFFDAQQRS